MVAIQGINGIPDPKSDRPAKVRDAKKHEAEVRAPAKDGLVISSEAQAAAQISKTIQAAQTGGDIRADRVAAARQSIERGDYRDPEIVAQVAQKISKYLP